MVSRCPKCNLVLTDSEFLAGKCPDCGARVDGSGADITSRPPPPRRDDAFSERPAERARERYQDGPQADALPSLAKLGGSSLSNLGQAAREKQLNVCRGVLFVIGALQIGWQTFQLVYLIPNRVEELRRQPNVRVDDDHVRMVKMLVGGALGAGVVYLILGALVKAYPLPCTILGLVVYVSVELVALVMVPESIKDGVYFKIFIIVMFVSAIKAAKAYQDFREEEGVPQQA